MPIKDRDTFAQECVLQGIFLGVNSHYLLASAEFRSGIKDDTVGDQIGPYRVTQTFWDANGSASDLEIVLDPNDINSWRLQVLFAALAAFRAQNRCWIGSALFQARSSCTGNNGRTVLPIFRPSFRPLSMRRQTWSILQL